MEALLNGVLSGSLTFHFGKAPWHTFSLNVNGLQTQMYVKSQLGFCISHQALKTRDTCICQYKHITQWEIIITNVHFLLLSSSKNDNAHIYILHSSILWIYDSWYFAKTQSEENTKRYWSWRSVVDFIHDCCYVLNDFN